MRRKTKKYNRGGLLQGKSHAQGGMPAIIGGQEPVELEGGEYIIRESSVQKYGAGTIARINQGLINPNELRKLEHGGSVNRRNNMATRNNRSRKRMIPGRTGYGQGGRVSGRRRFQQGGHTHIPQGGLGAPNHKHSMYNHVSQMHAGQFNSSDQESMLSGHVHQAHQQNWYGSGEASGDTGRHGHGSSTINPNPRGNGGMRMETRRGGVKAGSVPNPATGKFENGGMVNSCPPGQHMMPNGTCMNDSDMPGYRRANPNTRGMRAGYRRGGRIGRRRR